MARGAPVRAGRALQSFDFLSGQLRRCEAQISAQIEFLSPPGDGGDAPTAPTAPTEKTASRTAPGDKPTARALHRIMGVDPAAIPAIGVEAAPAIASEIGPDFSAFPSAQHFCSWLGLAPGTRAGGGKPLPGRSRKVADKVTRALRMAAAAARRSQTFIGARHRALLSRKDKPVATAATARNLACLIYLMAARGEDCAERGMQTFEKVRAARTVVNLERRAGRIGYRLVKIAKSGDEAAAVSAG